MSSGLCTNRRLKAKTLQCRWWHHPVPQSLKGWLKAWSWPPYPWMFSGGIKEWEDREHQVKPYVICVGFCLQFIIPGITQFIAWCIDSHSAWWVVSRWQGPAWESTAVALPPLQPEPTHGLGDQNAMEGPQERKPQWVEAAASHSCAPTP